MTNKKIIVGIAAAVLLFAAGTVSAQELVADLGDVRIYYYGEGSFGVESDRANVCLPLNFYRRAGWIEIVCSSASVKFFSGQIGDSVGSVVAAAFSPYLSPFGSAILGQVAEEVASWAASEGIDYLCGN